MDIITKGYVPRSGKFQCGGWEPAQLEVNIKHQSRLMPLEIDEVEIAA
jgi:hypothetical protein